MALGLNKEPGIKAPDIAAAYSKTMIRKDPDEKINAAMASRYFYRVTQDDTGFFDRFKDPSELSFEEQLYNEKKYARKEKQAASSDRPLTKSLISCYERIVDMSLQPLRNGLNAKNIMQALSIYYANRIFSSQFRDYRKIRDQKKRMDRATSRLEKISEKDLQTDRGREKAKSRAERWRVMANDPYTVDTAALEAVRLKYRAYQLFREQPVEKWPEIDEAYTTARNRLINTATANKMMTKQDISMAEKAVVYTLCNQYPEMKDAFYWSSYGRKPEFGADGKWTGAFHHPDGSIHSTCDSVRVPMKTEEMASRQFSLHLDSLNLSPEMANRINDVAGMASGRLPIDPEAGYAKGFTPEQLGAIQNMKKHLAYAVSDGGLSVRDPERFAQKELHLWCEDGVVKTEENIWNLVQSAGKKDLPDTQEAMNELADTAGYIALFAEGGNTVDLADQLKAAESIRQHPFGKELEETLAQCRMNMSEAQISQMNAYFPLPDRFYDLGAEARASLENIQMGRYAMFKTALQKGGPDAANPSKEIARELLFKTMDARHVVRGSKALEATRQMPSMDEFGEVYTYDVPMGKEEMFELKGRADKLCQAEADLLSNNSTEVVFNSKNTSETCHDDVKYIKAMIDKFNRFVPDEKAKMTYEEAADHLKNKTQPLVKKTMSEKIKKAYPGPSGPRFR